MKIAVLERRRKTQYGGDDFMVREDNIRMFENQGVFIMPVSNTVDIDFVVENCDGLYVPGGGDVDPSFYHEEMNGSIDVVKEMDENDFAYIDAFHKAGKPILGICRGHQIINVFFGGSLHQDIPNHDNVWHEVNVDKDSFVYDLYKTERLKVNSWHHQSVKDVAPGFKVIARSDDGTIEAMQYKNIYTVQWHPEMYDADKFISYIIENLFKK